jgi:hypothetical protein
MGDGLTNHFEDVSGGMQESYGEWGRKSKGVSQAILFRYSRALNCSRSSFSFYTSAVPTLPSRGGQHAADFSQ